MSADTEPPLGYCAKRFILSSLNSLLRLLQIKASAKKTTTTPNQLM